MKKKNCLMLMTALICLSILGGCGKNVQEIEVNPDVPERISEFDKELNDNSTISEDSSDINDENNTANLDIHSEEDYYIEMAVSKLGISEEEILSVNVDSYEGENLYSAFVFAGEFDEVLEAYEGQVWYINGDIIEPLFDSPTGFYTTGDVMKFSNSDKCFFYIDEYYVTQAVSHVYGIEQGKLYEPEISCRGSVSKVVDDKFTIIDSSYDGFYTSEYDTYMGHTWKPYYFSYDGENERFVEDKGVLIDEDTLKQECDEDILKEINAIDGEVINIYKRNNGIYTVNYQIKTDMDDYYEVTYKNANYNSITKTYIDAWGTEQFDFAGSDFGGTYNAALIP